MQLLPAHCRACGSVFLAARTSVDQVEAPCSGCGCQAQVAAGPSFGEHEQTLFEALTTLVRRSGLRTAEAQRLCIDIEMGLAHTDHLGTLQRVTRRLPELAHMVPRLGDSPAIQARTLRMLETILNALSIPKKSVSVSIPLSPVALKKNA
ncbi:MAG TPA: hypothetical protein VJN18_00225 [Polyangiaceae bacterium]|nr:hypothetical protein [Polyangiaceae bacterium]